jgi:hypothetical protein
MSDDTEKYRPRHNIDDVAKRSGVSRRTLERWMREGKIEKPRMQVVNGEARRVWSDADSVKVRAYKLKHFRQGCGRRKPVEQRMSTSGGIFEVFVRNPKRLYDACVLGTEAYAALINCAVF